LCTSGTIIRPNSIETRKPIARYMIGSIMDGYSKPDEELSITMPWRTGTAPARGRVNLNAEALCAHFFVEHDFRATHCAFVAGRSLQNGFQVARGVNLR
jgi:hypothetical protein